MHITVALSYFHRKIGPTCLHYYPEDTLEEEQKIRIADVMDSAFEESFFSHSFNNLISMNYYFEIYSKWARGQKEMVMISVIFDESVTPDIEHEVLAQCIDFAQKLKTNIDIFKAFYNEDDPQFTQIEADSIKEYSELIRLWVKEIYWVTVEIAREKSEEEIIATLMSQKSVYETIKFLSNGPVSKEDIEIWFYGKFPDLDLDEILDKLEEERFVFINDIGVEIYVLLVKEVESLRVPPDVIVTMFEEKPELGDLTALLVEKVQEFFNNYEPTLEDSLDLFKLASDTQVYTVLSQLRTGPIPKERFLATVTEDQAKKIFKILDTLKEKDIIDEFEYEGENLIILKSNLRFSTSFPKYLASLIPKETKSSIAKAYNPRHLSKLKTENEENSKVKMGLNQLNENEINNLFSSFDDEE